MPSYFIQGASGGPIKIGHCNGNAKKRLSQLQVGSPEELTLLATTEVKEYELHQRFGEHRIRGEWFEDCPELLEYIDNEAVKHRGSIAKRFEDIVTIQQAAKELHIGLQRLKRMCIDSGIAIRWGGSDRHPRLKVEMSEVVAMLMAKKYVPAVQVN